jgi:hypothetical protein
MIGVSCIAIVKPNELAKTFGTISPKNKIINVMPNDIMINHIAHVIAKPLIILSHNDQAYNDNMTLTRLFHSKMVIIVCFACSLRFISKIKVLFSGSKRSCLFIL